MPQPRDVSRVANKVEGQPVLQMGARVGYAVNGVLHLLIGWIGVQVACSASGKSADQSGALETLAREHPGTVDTRPGAPRRATHRHATDCTASRPRSSRTATTSWTCFADQAGQHCLWTMQGRARPTSLGRLDQEPRPQPAVSADAVPNEDRFARPSITS